MHTIFEIDAEKRTPKYIQIIRSVTRSIQTGKLKKGDRILSINQLSNEFFLSRDTVQKAYNALEQEGILIPIKGKGYYINNTDVKAPFKILLLFNRIGNYKKQIYDSFIRSMGANAVVDLKIHHSNACLFEKFINTYRKEYDYFVIMPHFYENSEIAFQAIQSLPPEKMVILDKDIRCVNSTYSAVYQDFQNDICDALESKLDLMQKYEKMILVFPKIVSYPTEIVAGFRKFCMLNQFKYSIENEITPEHQMNRKEAYLVIEETDLVNLIRISKKNKLSPGKDVGIISFNDTPLKEILADGITVITTDHGKMGETAAEMILKNRKEKIKNPFRMIVRNTL